MPEKRENPFGTRETGVLEKNLVLKTRKREEKGKDLVLKTRSRKGDTGRSSAGKSDPENRVEKNLSLYFPLNFLSFPILLFPFFPLKFSLFPKNPPFSFPFSQIPLFCFFQDTPLVLPNTLYACMKRILVFSGSVFWIS